MSTKPSGLKSYLELIRLPNVFTAMADPLAGALVAGGALVFTEAWLPLIAVLIVSVCFYSAGMVFNDYFDLDIDREERPRRPLPSGRISPQAAFRLAVSLMVVALAVAAILTFMPRVQSSSGFDESWAANLLQRLVAHPALGLAAALAAIIVSYDYALKLYPVTRELGMGSCRALNFMLGLTLGFQIGEPQAAMWLPPLMLFCYVAIITAISRLETRLPVVRLAVRWLICGIVVLDAAFVATYNSGDSWLAVAVLVLLVPAVVLGKFFEMT